MTDDGKWFLNINDTAYKLFKRSATKWQKYIKEDWELGITSVRVAALGVLKWDKDHAFSDYLGRFLTIDTRLKWMLNNYPDMYIQFILFAGMEYGTDDTGEAWLALPRSVRENKMRYMIARWAAFPQIFWQIVNDMHSD